MSKSKKKIDVEFPLFTLHQIDDDCHIYYCIDIDKSSNELKNPILISKSINIRDNYPEKTYEFEVDNGSASWYKSHLQANGNYARDIVKITKRKVYGNIQSSKSFY
jgi:hypothetical protein